MNTAQEYSQRVQTVATRRELSLDDLYSTVDINRRRMHMLWNGAVKPGVDEEAKLAQALNVRTAVLQNDTANRVWIRLCEKSFEELFPDAMRRLVSSTGQRGSDSLEASDELIDALIDEVILEAQSHSLGDQLQLFPIDTTRGDLG